MVVSCLLHRYFFFIDWPRIIASDDEKKETVGKTEETVEKKETVGKTEETVGNGSESSLKKDDQSPEGKAADHKPKKRDEAMLF